MKVCNACACVSKTFLLQQNVLLESPLLRYVLGGKRCGLMHWLCVELNWTRHLRLLRISMRYGRASIGPHRDPFFASVIMYSSWGQALSLSIQISARASPRNGVDFNKIRSSNRTPNHPLKHVYPRTVLGQLEFQVLHERPQW